MDSKNKDTIYTKGFVPKNQTRRKVLCDEIVVNIVTSAPALKNLCSFFTGIKMPTEHTRSIAFLTSGCVVVRTNLPAPWRTKERKRDVGLGVITTLGDGRKRNGILP
ncbi:hypothetical protein AVEN_211043-1 [Araneus ventricosus]|uniref:Uncharacterized protein n=1 Tax=Araneus ventricosus TaxID=182803 RepID=A0A4Y2S4N3_ARAVE|nr:hypothetical protein AVEN_168472-1 [Araneus ventricosus]GBN82947.1 hypothetical protein AVEN_211043-1 [Araneus ventricosus]